MSPHSMPYRRILMSSAWPACGNDARLVYIVLLGLASSDGVVDASIRCVAEMSRMSVEQTESAIAEIASASYGPYIEDVPGVGWRLLNFDVDPRPRYEARRKAAYRARQATNG
jgi:hypothetical protein